MTATACDRSSTGCSDKYETLPELKRIDIFRTFVPSFQNSYSFLEALEDAAVGAVKRVMRDVVVSHSDAQAQSQAVTSSPPPNEEPSSAAPSSNTLTAMASDMARRAPSQEWVELMDVLAGSLVLLLRRIDEIHRVINEAIQSVNAASAAEADEKEEEDEEDYDEANNPFADPGEEEGGCSSTSTTNNNVLVPDHLLRTLTATNKEVRGKNRKKVVRIQIPTKYLFFFPQVLINVCEQMHERLAKLLACRSRPNGASALLTVPELTQLGLVVAVFAEETRRRSGRHSTGLQLSLQSQTVLYAQSFDEAQREALSAALERETWKRSARDPAPVVNRLAAIPAIARAFQVPEEEEEEEEGAEEEEEEEGNGMVNGVKTVNGSAGGDSKRTGSKPAAPQSSPFDLVIGLERFAVTECVPAFLKCVAEYCNLCSMLPSVTVELGLKAAELVKFFNSRVCQLVLGAGAISVSGLRTITIRNLALAHRDVQAVQRILPYVLLHFQVGKLRTKFGNMKIEKNQ